MVELRLFKIGLVSAGLLLAGCGDQSPAPDQTETSPAINEQAQTVSAPPEPVGFSRRAPDPDTDIESLAARIHADVFTFDAHVDIPADFGEGEHDPGNETSMQVDLPKMEAGGLDGAAFALFTRQGPRTPEGYQAAKAEIDAKLMGIEKVARVHSNQIGIAASSSDMRALFEAGKKVAVVSMLNGYPLGEDLSLVDAYYDRGLRMIGFTHAGHNALADSSRPQEQWGDTAEEHGGLSPLGEQLVRLMNRKGMIVDVSQLTTAGLFEAVSITEAPVVASHSAVRALADTPRNLTDEELQAVADTGGVVHIVAFPAYVKDRPPGYRPALMEIFNDFGLRTANDLREMPAEAREKYDAAVEELNVEFPKPTVKDYISAIDYAVDLIGINHVGISTDMGHGGGLPGWTTAAESGVVTVELVRRGYDETAIAKLWGENFMRVFSDVETIAASLVSEMEAGE